MKKVIVRAPVRADLAGGTLDLWPLYLFHPGSRTINVAISYHAESEVAETGDDMIDVHLADQQYEHRYESIHELAADPKAALIHRASSTSISPASASPPAPTLLGDRAWAAPRR